MNLSMREYVSIYIYELQPLKATSAQCGRFPRYYTKGKAHVTRAFPGLKGICLRPLDARVPAFAHRAYLKISVHSYISLVAVTFPKSLLLFLGHSHVLRVTVTFPWSQSRSPSHCYFFLVTVTFSESQLLFLGHSHVLRVTVTFSWSQSRSPSHSYFSLVTVTFPWS
jgi:hypothetical protein